MPLSRSIERARLRSLMPVIKNQRRELFAEGLAQGKTADAAYENAGYKPNRHNASRLKTNETIIARVLELQAEKQERFVLTRQYLIEAIIENIEKALGRRPTIGADGTEVFVYRGEVVNNAIRMAGVEIGMFREQKDLRIHTDFPDLTDVELVRRVRDEANALLLEHQTKIVDVTPEKG
jgi:phage terminase small subunit